MGYGDGTVREGFDVDELFDIITQATKKVKDQLKVIQGEGESISIPQMFEMQMLMNHLAQLSEMSTGLVSSANQAINSMARGVKS